MGKRLEVENGSVRDADDVTLVRCPHCGDVVEATELEVVE